MNIIDSFIVELGIDPKNLTQGQQEAVDSFKRTQNEVTRSSREIERSAEKMGQEIGKVIARVLELSAVLLGARGLTEFAIEINSINAQLGRLAVNLGESPQTLGAWENAAQRLGGSAEKTASTFQGLAKSLYDLTVNGKALPIEFSQLAAFANMSIDPYHGLDKYLNDVAAALKKVHDVDPARANFLAQGLGIDPGTAQLMYQYGAGVSAYVHSLESLSPTNEDIRSAQELQAAWAQLQQTAISLAQDALPKLREVLVPLLNNFSNWISEHKTEIDDTIGNLATWFAELDWEGMARDATAFGNGVGYVVDQLGGLVNVLKILLALWAGGKVLGILRGLGLLGAGAAAGGVAAGGTAAGTAAGGAAVGAGTYAGASSLTGIGGIITALGIATSAWLMTTTSAGGEDRVRPDQAPGPGWWKGGYSPFTYAMLDALRERKTTEPNQRVSVHLFQDRPNVPPPVEPGRGWWKGETTPFSSRMLDYVLNLNGRPVSDANPVPVKPAGTLFPELKGEWGSWWNNVFANSSAYAGPGTTPKDRDTSALPAPTGPMPKSQWWTNEHQAYIYQRLRKEAGLSDAGARGLISRWMNVEAPGGPASYNMIGGGHWGIAQMGQSRLRSSGLKWGDADLAHQMDAIIWELNHTEKRAAEALRSATTFAQGAVGASMYERAEGYNASTGRDYFTDKTLQGVGRVNPVPSNDWYHRGMERVKANSVSNHSSTTTNSTHISELHVHSQAKDAAGIAGDLRKSIERSSVTGLANTGLA